jgi:hypothetical protein
MDRLFSKSRAAEECNHPESKPNIAFAVFGTILASTTRTIVLPF